ncbi:MULTISPECIES: ExbD/TolR family protein [Acinetobacter]|jgi:biopolymer transport protein ExbD|uniref:Biopolymer transporter ExbD n=1 Tax=Acinetobacter pittii TaxID=48296 RepID=A0AAE9S6W9_ACIPI|nr:MULTISPECIES: biopolymer transporter ExbD [Acinetobacter]AZP29545.1 biopolymer transporter ExbD [Acinetobacter pittii]EXE26083.1 biopolymer transport ExbD/TolR family protein [Acinetobacter sp. 907131]EXS17589.1 biopolymer transport ExbD/TolR family protein [Acinetobacter sp. 883425]MBK0409757.1 biopolymer transporter ExbD [Acinetobacter pittii]MBK1415966.1 biopolymer transporter ExbD [Acinetobacter pittii]
MGMNVGSNNDDDVMLEVNMTPLIDVMLVLIIMFIITIPTPNNAININLPNGTPPPTNEKPPEVIDVRIDAVGKVFWNNQEVSDRKALETLFQGVVAKKDQDQIKLKPDQMAEYKNVAMVMATAQRLGVTKIGIVSSN